MRVGVFHPGTQHSWQTARTLNHLGILAWYATTIFYDHGRWPYAIEDWLPGPLRNRLHAELTRFFHPDLPSACVRRMGYHEWIERVLNRTGAPALARRVNRAGNIAFAKSVRRLIEREPVDALWGYDSSSLGAFTYARQNGIACVLEKTIGDPRIYSRIMEPHWRQYREFFLARDFDIEPGYLDALDREMDLADVVLAGSEFARRTIVDPEARPDLAGKIKVVPYCFDDVFFTPPPASAVRDITCPIRFIFVGQVHPRKGAHLLLRAFARIPASAASLTLVGGLGVPTETFARYAHRVTYHPTVPRREVRRLLLEADCFVFPTLFEGFAVVLMEALASGLGIVQSANVGIAASENTGRVLADATEEHLYEALMEIVDAPHRLANWRAHAEERALNFSFDRYRDSVHAVIEGLATIA